MTVPFVRLVNIVLYAVPGTPLHEIVIFYHDLASKKICWLYDTGDGTGVVITEGVPRNYPSPQHQREHTPAQVFTRVSGVALGFRGQFGSNIFRGLVVGIGFKPSAHGEPTGRPGS